jgi:hypothetical protein
VSAGWTAMEKKFTVVYYSADASVATVLKMIFFYKLRVGPWPTPWFRP